MKEFMFIYKGTDPTWREKATPDEMAGVMAQWGKWMAALGETGQLVTGGSPLDPGGKRVKKDGVLTDIAASEL
jgi:hypothetical protein